MNDSLLQCKNCGHTYIKLPWWSRIQELFIFVDPAPNPLTVFRKERCPKCGSTKLKKV